jgi:hypothetical protein
MRAVCQEAERRVCWCALQEIKYEQSRQQTQAEKGTNGSQRKGSRELRAGVGVRVGVGIRVGLWVGIRPPKWAAAGRHSAGTSQHPLTRRISPAPLGANCKQPWF